MIQYRFPVRINTPQKFNYTFRDQSKNLIPLDNYVSVVMEAKVQGQVFSSISASFVGGRASGKVSVSAFSFPTVGVWTIQFFAVDGVGVKLPGEPIQVKTFPNVEDLTSNQLAEY